MIDIEALEAEAAAEEAAASAVKLSEDEQRAAAAIARFAKAREERAAAEKSRRGLDLAAREKRARAAYPKQLVKGVDLVDLFPLGSSPSAEQLPGGGVIVVRSPDPQRLKSFHTEVEHKARPVADIYADLLCESTVDPDPQKDAAAGVLLRAFCDAYPGAAIGAGDVVAKLGGSKAQADKRGRS